MTIPIAGIFEGPAISVTDCVHREGTLGCLGSQYDQRLDFGDIPPQGCRSAEVMVSNLGRAPLEVDAPLLVNTAPGGFRLDTPAAPFSVPPIASNGSVASAVLTLTFCMDNDDCDSRQGVLRLTSNDPTRPTVVFDLIGGGFDGQGLTCQCTYATELTVPVGDTVFLSPRCSSSCDVGPVRHLWSLEQAPPGSTTQLLDTSAPETSLVADVVTPANQPYVVSLNAAASLGRSATCRYTIQAVPPPSLWIELLWDQPSTDLDLHLLNPEGSAKPGDFGGWFSLKNDCHYLNNRPDWGTVGLADDDPIFTWDEVNGFGPEIIRLPLARPGVYTVGVHYFCDDTLGASEARVRLSCDGVEAATFGPRLMSQSGDFWEVATVEWPGCIVTPVDELSSLHRGCLGLP